MALHPDFPESPYAILDPALRWFPADEALRESSSEKLIPPLVGQLRCRVREFRDSGYVGATDTSKSLLNWWFNRDHLLRQADGTMAEFRYYFAQREALETIIYLYDVVGVQDKYDLMRFDSSGSVSTGMFDESWRRFVIKMQQAPARPRCSAWCWPGASIPGRSGGCWLALGNTKRKHSSALSRPCYARTNRRPDAHCG